MTRTTGSRTVELRLSLQQAALLTEILADLEIAIWNVYGDELALLADAELALGAEDDPDLAGDIPF